MRSHVRRHQFLRTSGASLTAACAARSRATAALVAPVEIRGSQSMRLLRM